MDRTDRFGWTVFYLALAFHVLWTTGCLIYFLVTD